MATDTDILMHIYIGLWRRSVTYWSVLAEGTLKNWQTISHTTQETQAEFGRRSSGEMWITSTCLWRGSSNNPESSEHLSDGKNVHLENVKKQPTCLIWNIQSV